MNYPVSLNSPLALPHLNCLFLSSDVSLKAIEIDSEWKQGFLLVFVSLIVLFGLVFFNIHRGMSRTNQAVGNISKRN